MRTLSLAVLVTGALLLSVPATGQTALDSLRRRIECRLAVHVITTGQPAPRLEWAWYRIGYCDPASTLTAYESAIRRARSSTDLPFVRYAMSRAVFFQDARTFALLLDIAADRTATPEARVAALIALGYIRNPGVVVDDEMFGVPPDAYGHPPAVCMRQTMHPRSHRTGPNPLPPDALEQIRQLQARIYVDPTEPVEIRSAAGCG